MTYPATGSRMKTKIVSCHEMTSIIEMQAMIITGFLNIMSSEAMTDDSISATSPLMRAMTSPLRSAVKNEMGSVVILS